MLFILFTILIINYGWAFNTILSVQIVLFILTLNFFRVPKRVFERKDGEVYSPCDGKVVVIEETTEHEFYKDKRIQVSIFMSPLNVHNAAIKRAAGFHVECWRPPILVVIVGTAFAIVLPLPRSLSPAA